MPCYVDGTWTLLFFRVLLGVFRGARHGRRNAGSRTFSHVSTRLAGAHSAPELHTAAAKIHMGTKQSWLCAVCCACFHGMYAKSVEITLAVLFLRERIRRMAHCCCCCVVSPTAAIFVAMACSSRHHKTLAHHILRTNPLTCRCREKSG